MLIEGNTEDGVEPESDEKKEEQPLRVTYQDYILSVKAKQQPLPLILLKIGEVVGIPVDIQDEKMDLVDANISKLSVEEAIKQLSPNIKLFVRADLSRSERRTLRLVLTEPPKAVQDGRWALAVTELPRTCDPIFWLPRGLATTYINYTDSRRRQILVKQNEILKEESAGLQTEGIGKELSERKKPFVEPAISVPVDVLEATTFFQAASSGATN